MNYNYNLRCYEAILVSYDLKGKKIGRCLFYFKADPASFIIENIRINNRLFCKVLLGNHAYIFYKGSYTRLCNTYIRHVRSFYE